jgi:coenzyme F420 hydrogenase subunit beta
MKNTGSEAVVSHVIDKGMCIGCGGCVNLCPYFKSFRGVTSQLFSCNLEQGRCFSFCPKIEVDLDALSGFVHGQPYPEDALGPRLSLHVSRAGKAAPSGRFQAGGTVTALVSFALSRKMVDCAVLTDRDGLEPVPRIVTRPEEAVACATSKYTAAPTLAGVNQALGEGCSALAAVATPCQALSLAQMRATSPDSGGYGDRIKLVVGLFCTWALDLRRFRDFLAERIDPGTIEKIDIPPPPAEELVVFAGGETRRFPLAEVRECVPYSCGFCPDMTAELADVSVGVMEGSPGKNTLVVRTQAGKKLVREAAAAGYLELEPYPDAALEHLTWAAGNKKKRALLQLGEKGLLNTEAEDVASCIRLRPEAVDKIVS